MIILYRLIAGLWQAVGQPSVAPPAPPPPPSGYGVGPYGAVAYI